MHQEFTKTQTVNISDQQSSWQLKNGPTGTFFKIIGYTKYLDEQYLIIDLLLIEWWMFYLGS